MGVSNCCKSKPDGHEADLVDHIDRKRPEAHGVCEKKDLPKSSAEQHEVLSCLEFADDLKKVHEINEQEGN